MESVCENSISPQCAATGERAHMDSQTLLVLYHETGDEELKWELVLRYTNLVRRMAAQVCGLYSSFAQLDDIISEGVLVLLDAVDKFDPQKGVKFETYVSKRLRGMIIDLAREQDWMPRQVRQKSIRLKRAAEDLSVQLGHTPSSQEIADYLGVSKEEYDRMRAETAAAGLVSLDALLDACGSTGSHWTQDTGSGCLPEAQYEEKELQATLQQGISSLRENEQLVLSLYYERELNMKEIAQVMRVSAPRVSQIHSKAIQHLRQYMQQHYENR